MHILAYVTDIESARVLKRASASHRYFNAVQSESFAEVFLADDNLEISSPTGSGKTVLFELICFLRLLGKSLTAEGQFKHVSGSRKTVRFIQWICRIIISTT